MTSTSRREEYSSNIIRTLHPTTITTTTNNDLNENIDYLLDDLQNSVTGTSQYLQSKNMQHLNPANTTTYIKERSISPGRSDYQNRNKVYKTSSYQYTSSSSGGANTTLDSSQNVSQLDTLLQDLKKERELSTREKDYTLSTSYSGFESGQLGRRSPNLIETRSPKLETRLIEDKLSIKRDVGFDSSSQNSPMWNTSTPSERSHVYEKKVESTTSRDVSFAGDTLKSEIHQTPTLSRTEKYIENKTVPYYEPSTVITSHNVLAEDLKNVPLSDDILPVPGTKVTTTVRTYTYEIPAEPVAQTTTKKILYKREMDSNETNSYPGRQLPPSVTYKTESYRTTNETDGSVPLIQSSNTFIRKKNINETTSNTNVDRNVINEYVTEQTPLFENTVRYRRDVVDNNSRDVIDSSTLPPHTNGPHGPTTYYYKHHESTNTTNTLYDDQNPPIQPVRPVEPSTKTLKFSSYSSTHTHTNDREPLLQPGPFPTDGTEPIGQMESPPKRLDDLMASLGNENINSRQTDIELHKSRREVETAVATAERPPPSKNVAGPPVYYPPGREMFMKKEESAAGYRAGGQYARAAGKYEYEAESKSKSKSKSGAAMVPVCLPLCCAMPCSIM